MICFHEPYARVEARARRKSSELILEATLEHLENTLYSAKKNLLMNHQPIRRLSELIGQVKVVLFTPQDEWIVQGEPSRRRRFLDFLLGQLSAQYLHELQQYQMVKDQRNTLLKRPHSKSELSPWNTQLVESGGYLLQKRLEVIPKLEAAARALYQELSEGKEKLTIAYESTVNTSNDSKPGVILEKFTEALERVAPEESARGITLIGPHRDDLGIFFDGVEARLFGSLGQQKTAALSLKLAEGVLFLERDDEPPIYLLDDCFSELDALRQEAIQKIFESKAQMILTSALAPPSFLKGAELFKLESGTLSAEGRDLARSH